MLASVDPKPGSLESIMAKRSASSSPREKSVAQPIEGGTLRVKLPEPVFPPVEKTSQAFKPLMPLARNLPLPGPPPKVVTPAASKEQTPPSRVNVSISSLEAKRSSQPETLSQEKRSIEEPSQIHQESQVRSQPKAKPQEERASGRP